MNQTEPDGVWQTTILGYTLQGGVSRPEQWDVFSGNAESGHKLVGFVRLRCGVLTANLIVRCVCGARVYESREMRGQDCFHDDERDGFLLAAVTAIDAALKSKEPNAA